MADSFMAAVGEPDIKGKLNKGHKAGNKTFKVHLDGYNQLPYLTGKEEKGSRKEFFYFSDDAELIGLRYNDWKAVFMEQRAHRFDVWRDPFFVFRLQKKYFIFVKLFGLGYLDFGDSNLFRSSMKRRSRKPNTVLPRLKRQWRKKSSRSPA